MIEIVVERLVGFPEGDYVMDHIFWGFLVDQDARNKVCDRFHFCFVHTQAGNFNGADTEATWTVPIGRLIARNEVFIRDNIGACQALSHL